MHFPSNVIVIYLKLLFKRYLYMIYLIHLILEIIENVLIILFF